MNGLRPDISMGHFLLRFVFIRQLNLEKSFLKNGDLNIWRGDKKSHTPYKKNILGE